MEGFRGGRSSGSGIGSAMLGSVLVSGLGSSGSSTLGMCPSEDTSFFCQFTRIFKMIMMSLTVIGIIMVAYYFFVAPKSARGFFGGFRGKSFLA